VEWADLAAWAVALAAVCPVAFLAAFPVFRADCPALAVNRQERKNRYIQQSFAKGIEFMALKIRLARGGAKKRPFYRIVVAEASAPRDGRYVERVGTYNPMVPKDHDQRLVLKNERITYWLGQGAQPTERVQKMLASAGLTEAPDIREQPKKSAPGKKRAEREAAAAEAAAEAEAAAAEAPADEAPAEEVAADEAPADEAPAEEATADEAPADAAPAEEAAADEAPAEEAPAEEAGDDSKD